jgi:ABC-type antimicrobial peptide transport system permease subunit
MRTVRESNAPLLAAVAISNFIFKSITETLYALSIRRALRAIERFG